MLHLSTISFEVLLITLSLNQSCDAIPSASQTERRSQIELKSCQFPNHKSDLLCGEFAFYENRASMSGRIFSLNMIIAPAYVSVSQPDPVFSLAGGPGQGQARMASGGEDGPTRAIRQQLSTELLASYSR